MWLAPTAVIMNKAFRFGKVASFLLEAIGRSVRRAGTVVAHGLKWASEIKQLARSERPVVRAREEAEIPLHATVPPKTRTAAVNRHEVSSLQGPHAIAAGDVALGAELVDPEAVEVPIGSTSDPSYRDQLSHSKLPQPSTTGAALFGKDERIDGTFEGTLQPFQREITAQPSERPRLGDTEPYDAMAPENAGLEWLNRATEAPAGSIDTNPVENMLIEGELGSALTSEGSLEASMPHELIDEDEMETEDAGEERSRAVIGHAAHR